MDPEAVERLKPVVRVARHDDRFGETPWSCGENGAPILKESLSVFECERFAVYDGGDHHIGDMNRRLGYRDTYDLILDGDPERRIDRRLAVSLGIALDALQSR